MLTPQPNSTIYRATRMYHTVTSNHGNPEVFTNVEEALKRAQTLSARKASASNHSPNSDAFRPSQTGRASVYRNIMALEEGNRTGWLGTPDLRIKGGTWIAKDSVEDQWHFVGGKEVTA